MGKTKEGNGEESRSQLLAIINRQQLQIKALQRRIEALEVEDVGQLRERVKELENWKEEAENRIRQLEIKSAMTQGLLTFVGTSTVALIGEKVAEALSSLSMDELEAGFNTISDEKWAELEDQFGEFLPKIMQYVEQIDTVSLQSWQQQRKILEYRASTLPPLKRAMFDALNQFAAPSKLGTQLINLMLNTEDFSDKLTDEEKRKIELSCAVFDTFSNIWPLTVTNSLTPLLKYVGFDDAAEAAGEILDQLEAGNNVPRHLIHKVRIDLVNSGAIQGSTKPNTIIEFFENGFRLQQLGCSPDEAASYGYILASATQLKRAKHAFEGLQTLYNRTKDYLGNIHLENLETFGQSFKRAAEEKVGELRELVVAELT